MIAFVLGFTLGAIFGVVGLVCVAIMYDKHHPDRTALTDSFVESLELLADAVESQMKEVK